MSIVWKRGVKRLNRIENLELNHLFEERTMADEQEEAKTLKELFSPITTNPPSCIVLPATTANHFELKPQVMQLLPNFHGIDQEDPYLHIKDFLEICATFKFQNFSDESVRLRLFPFSLKGKAKAWLNSLPSRSITGWEILVSKFLTKFFPMSKTNELRRQISDFCQEDNEKFYESWERFKDILLRCPHHGFETWRLVQFFYNGLTQTNRNMIESMNSGTFLSLTEDEAYNFLENLSESSQQWDFSSHRNSSAQVKKEVKKEGIYELSESVETRRQLDSLLKKLEALTLRLNSNSVNQIQAEGCSVCANPMHASQTCPSMVGFPEFMPQQVNAMNEYNKQFNSPFTETYNPGWRNHPNFSWTQAQPIPNMGSPSGSVPRQQPPPGFRPPINSYQPFQPALSALSPHVTPQQFSSLEDTLKQFIQVTTQNNQTSSQLLQEVRNNGLMNTQAIIRLESQMGQLASQLGEKEKGKFPSQPIPNPKGVSSSRTTPNPPNAPIHGQVQAITTIRSEKVIDNKVRMLDNKEEEKEEEEQIPTKVESSPQVVNQTPLTKQVIEDTSSKTFVPKVPFPHRLKDNKKGTQFEEILEVFKQVQINIPLLDAIKQVPSYAKFLKDLVTQKRRTNVPKKAFLTEQASSIIQCKIPIKYKDPGCPTITCKIGNYHIERALVDLRASVNLLPYSVFKQLGLGELKPTPMTIQLADRSVKFPRGVIEDVLIQVETFYFPVDFVVLDTQPVQNTNGQIPVILGRPFLATVNALINCRNGLMKISFGNMTAELDVFDTSKQPQEEEVKSVNMIGSWIFDGECDELEEDFITLLGDEVNDPKFVEEARSMSRMKEKEWDAEVHNFLFSELDSERDESLDSVKLCESIPFDPGILELKSSDSSPLEKPYSPIDFLLPSVEPIELIHLIFSDLEPDISRQILEVSGWFNKYVHVVIIISADLPPDKYSFCN
ncbi:hypothetical protein LguiA_000093 [Lonicera macranthoides]